MLLFIQLCLPHCRYVVLTVIDDGSEPECLLGHVVIDLDNFNTEVEFRGSFQLSDMVTRSSRFRYRCKWAAVTLRHLVSESQ